MGVKGLTSYIRTIVSNVSEEKNLEDSEVILDGKAILYYFQEKIDSRYGAQYDYIARDAEHFFNCFKGQNIKLHVLFDGPNVIVKKKLETLLRRGQEKIERCDKLSKQIPQNVDHPLSIRLLVQTMQGLQIPFTVCHGEADKEVAICANERNCPVISSDSDFCIYDIPGFIPLSNLRYTEGEVTARIYHRSQLAQHLEISETLLPLLASLLGNDYVGEDKLLPLDEALGLRKPRGHAVKINKKLNKFQGLLSNHETIGKAMDSVLGIISEQSKRESLRNAIVESVQEYAISGLTVAAFREQNEIPSDRIPQYVIDRYHHGNFPVRYMGIIHCKKQILRFQVEDMRKISSHDCSKMLRQTIYGIISPDSRRIIEWDRDGLNLRKLKVKPNLVLSGGDLQVPNLDTIRTQDTVQRRNLIFIILEANEAIQSFPETEQLFAASIRYWIRHADPKVTKIHVKVLILQYLVQQEVCVTCESLLETEGEPSIDIALLHSLAQWQAVMVECLHLNQILLDALPEPDLSRIFNGVIAQNINAELQQGKSPQDMFHQLDDFNRIYSAVKKKGKAKEKKKSKATKEAVNLGSNPFAVLMEPSSSYEDGDECGSD